MGSTTNGYSPFDILYEITDEAEVDGFITHDPYATPCQEPVGVRYFCDFFTSYKIVKTFS